MWSGLFLGFLFVVQTKSLSVLTDDRPQTSGPGGETAKTDILRQLLNQETLIRMALDKKVYDLDKDFIEMKENMAEMKNNNVNNNKQLQDAKREIEINKQQLQDAKREIETNKQQLQDAKREIETNKQQLQDAKREIETNKQQLQDAKREIQTNNRQLQDAKREIQTNNQQLQDAKRETETNNQQLQDAKREIQTNNQQLQDAKRETETNNQQLQDAKREIQTNNQQLQDAKREIETNKQQLQDAKREIETNKQQLQDAKRQIETNKQQLQDAKRQIEFNMQQLRDTKAEIAVLKDEMRSLKTQLNASKANAFKFQKEVEIEFEATDENITQLLNNQERYGRKLSYDVEIFKTNTTNDLADIRRDVRSLFSSMLILENQTTKLNTSLPEAINKKLTDVSVNWNRSLSELNHRFVYTCSKMDNDHANKMAQLSDGINDTINTMKTEVNQSQKSQLELSSAVSSVVSSLEVIRHNMSLLNGPVKDTPVGFTAGMKVYSDSWQGDILVFNNVITNKGQGYSSQTGKFTAPREGTYVFTVTGVSWLRDWFSLDIVQDGVRKVRTWSDSSSSGQSGTNLVVLELDRGDAVWVGRKQGRGYDTDKVPLTTFSGFIL
ncbi:uncharacterized protein LOC111100109 [Crassostrea virginica]